MVFTVLVIDCPNRACFKRLWTIAQRFLTFKIHQEISFFHSEDYNMYFTHKAFHIDAPAKKVYSFLNLQAVTQIHFLLSLKDTFSKTERKTRHVSLCSVPLQSNWFFHGWCVTEAQFKCTPRDLLLKSRSRQNLQNIYGFRKFELPKQKA